MRVSSALASLAAITIIGTACKTTNSASSVKNDEVPVEGAQPAVNSEAYIAQVARSTSTSTRVIDLYNVTEMGAEVDALSEPGGGGFEYWPFVWSDATSNHPWPYPDSIQWGYAAGSDQAKKCMKLSYHVYQYVLNNKPQSLTDLESVTGAPGGYFQWNNDYSRARAENMGMKSFWHYNRPGGLIKWISNTKMDGKCQHPTVEAIDRWATCEIKKLRNEAGQCPGHN